MKQLSKINWKHLKRIILKNILQHVAKNINDAELPRLALDACLAKGAVSDLLRQRVDCVCFRQEGRIDRQSLSCRRGHKLLGSFRVPSGLCRNRPLVQLCHLVVFFILWLIDGLTQQSFLLSKLIVFFSNALLKSLGKTLNLKHLCRIGPGAPSSLHHRHQCTIEDGAKHQVLPECNMRKLSHWLDHSTNSLHQLSIKFHGSLWKRFSGRKTRRAQILIGFDPT